MKSVLLLFAAVSLLVTPVIVVQASHRVADRAGKLAGSLAAQWLEPLRPQRASVPAQDEDVASPLPDGATVPAPIVQGTEVGSMNALAARPDRKRRGNKPRAAAPPQGGGVRVSAPQVLALAERRVMPRAVAVPASETHPAGLRLLNVSSLGLGMRDGDILTRVSGVPASSTGVVVEVVLRARAVQAREIAAEFWRNGALWSLVVEQPYLAATPSSSNGQWTERRQP